MDYQTTALKGLGSAVRRRRQLSRSCCHLAFEDDKREANLHPLTKGTHFRVPFSVVGRGGFTNHCALVRGSAVRRRRQLSRSCCQPAFEDEKREANLHPLTRGTKFMVPAFCAEKGWITEPRRFSAWFGCPPKAAAFAKLLPTGFRRRKAGSEPPPPYKRHQIYGAGFLR